jgi:alpha-2-macroglobulin
MSMLVSACSGGGSKAIPVTPKAPVPPVRLARTTGPFAVTLTAGHPAAATVDAVSVAGGEKLDDHAISAVVDRLPPFKTDGGAVPFKRPADSIPRPRVGATIDKPFGGTAPAPKPAPTDTGPLRVLRYQPIGDVAIAPDLSVTFSQPMVPLSTLAQLDQVTVPVKVTPALDGRWRWIGTRTLRFEFTGAVDRLPMATSYRVEVAAGTTSQTGHKLASAVQWTFRTPPPKVVTFAPEGVTVDTTPVFIAAFDQRVDPAAVLNTITLDAGGTKTAIRQATTAEVVAHDQIHQIAQDAPDGRWIAFRPVSQLANGAKLTISIGPGTPSAEGPGTTTTASTHTATTYSALVVTDSRCGYGEGCRPGSVFTVTFNNSLDPKAFNSDLVKIDPPVAASIGVGGNTLTVNASTKSDTHYVVRIPASLRDEFGQTLGAARLESFDVGEATPALMAFPHSLTTSDPSAKQPSVSVTSVGHQTLKVDVYATDPSRWLDYQNLLQTWGYKDGSLSTWPRLSTTTITVDGGGKELTESNIDLSSDLHGAPGHLLVVVSPTEQYPPNTELYYQNRPTITWVQSTTIGVDAIASNDQLVAWATDLRDGAPLSGVRVQLAGATNSDVTDADGVARLGLVRARYLTATKGNDVAVLPADAEYQWSPRKVSDSVTGFAFDDRGIYRPGETVHVKGWFRRVRTASDSTITPLGTAQTAHWSARDAFGNELGHGDVTLNSVSGFDLKINVPAGAALGGAQVAVSVDDAGVRGAATANFQIQEFRRPEFEVVTRVESAQPNVLTQPVTVAAAAQYFSGGVLADAPTTWQVTTSTGTYSPPNWSQFSFGVQQPYWMSEFGPGGFGLRGDIGISGPVGNGFSSPCCIPQPQNQKVATYAGRTDSTGTHYLQLNFDGQKPDLPVMVSANASVTDVNRQSFASNLEVLVHPSTLYVGIQSTRQFVREGEPIDVEGIVTDIDGKVVSGRTFTITASRVESNYQNGTLVETDVDPKHCEVTSGSKPVSCSIKAGTGGQYKISAVVVDDAGGHNRSEITRWVSGADTVPTRDVQQEAVTVVPNQEQYHPGDTAQLLVVAPFETGNGLLTVSANGAMQTQHFALDHGSAIVNVPIAQTDTRGLTVQVDIAGQAPRLRDDGTKDPTLPPRPAFASATLPLHVQAANETLTVSAVAQHRVSDPGSHDTVDVAVKGPDGSAVANADVAVVVVDEAVLSLTGYKLADPIGAMYPAQSDERPVDYLRSSLVLANPAVFGRHDAATTPATNAAGNYKAKSAARLSIAGDGLQGDVGIHGPVGASPQGPSGFAAGGLLSPLASKGRTVTQPLRVRTNFNALALFSPSVRTDAAGVAHVDFDLPDNLTRYRVMAVAADNGGRFGSGESTLTARLPLQVRPSAPRFANFGDRFELPVVVQNQTDKDMTVDVVAETSNLSLTDAHGLRVNVPANDRVEVRFPVKTDAAGTASYRISATHGPDADSASGEFPVYTPVTTEAFATYGTVDNGAIAQPLKTPTGVVPQYGGLEVDTSSTAMQALTDAVVYLDDYPYESADAYASRIIALTSLHDVFAAFGGQGVPSPTQVDARINADIKALTALQNNDGGFSTWTRGGDPQPYISVEAADALVLARLAGYAVSDSARSGALAYIHDIESKFPTYWDTPERHAVSAYALYVRNEAGDRDAAKADALYRSDPGLPLDALAWLWPIVDDPTIAGAISQTIANRVHDTPAGATFTTGYSDGANLILGSDRRTDGIVLNALITMQPDSELIPKVVTGLIGNQVKGRWDNIQENGFILVALHRYFAKYEAQTPSFVARVWLGDTYAAEHSFQGRSTVTEHTLVPMSDLNGDPGIVVQKAGTGRLYYRLGLQYAPSSLKVDALDEGFVVDRQYEAVNDPHDVSRDKDGTWHIKAGAMVRVRVTMVADSNHTNMALVDPMPAGLEALNPTLASSPRPPPDKHAADVGANQLPMWFGATWFDHENLRDDRVEAFASYLYGGTYDYTYVARATTPGEFVVPPAKAEEIYAPEVFGRSSSDRVNIG